MRRLLLLALLVSGCVSLPTSPDPSTFTERQQYIYDYTQCLGEWTGLGEIRVTFAEDIGDGAAGKAVTGHNWVRYHIASVENGPDWYLAQLASHEVAHLTGANEAEATRLESVWPEICGCGGE